MAASTPPLHPDDLLAWDIEPGYHDVQGAWHEPSPDAVHLLRRAMGAATDDPTERPGPRVPLRVLRPGDAMQLDQGDRLVLEDGTELAGHGNSPPDLPFGYHRIVHDRSGEAAEPVTNLIVTPGRCTLPQGLRTWGLTMGLYAARSSESWGMGDLADLRRVIDWADRHGAGVVGLNPLHAPDPRPDQPNSPYSPSSRRWRDPCYLAIEQVPGAADLPDRDALIARGRALNAGERIDRSATWAAKRTALEHLWSQFPGSAEFDRYRVTMGQDLDLWAVHCVLVDEFGPDWRSWPAPYRRAESPAVTAFANDHDYEVDFWAWLQWLLDGQLQASGAPDTVVADVAVGFDAGGADAWQWQDLIADGVHIGAPPDLLGPDGQDWGLPPFVPGLLRDQAYRPIAQTIRSVARHARGLRIDHVMGLFRLFWVPPGLSAADGAYVRFAGRELLDVVALESVRSGAFVIGEDLGTVEPEVREHLGSANVLSTRLLWFEDGPPETWPHQAMAAISTHDLPTLAGVWTGVDLDDQRQAEVTVPPDGDDEFRHRLRVSAGVGDGASTDQVAVGAHRALAAAPSMLVTATIDDLLGAEHRPNLPGTIDQHPNWRIPLPVPLDGLPGHPLAEVIAEVLQVLVRPEDPPDA